jgi:hypothetical protein
VNNTNFSKQSHRTLGAVSENRSLIPKNHPAGTFVDTPFLGD